MRVRLKFEPRDLWIGVYWRWLEASDNLAGLRLYVCVVPMLPIVIDWIYNRRRGE